VFEDETIIVERRQGVLELERASQDWMGLVERRAVAAELSR
jgi:hypothetical protein